MTNTSPSLLRFAAVFFLPTLFVPILANAQSMPGAGAQAAGFGRAVAVGDGDIFIGEPARNNTPGVVHVFERGTAPGSWTRYAELQADAGQSGDQFGRAVATDSNRLLVASAGEDDAGAVHVFAQTTGGGWTETAVLTSGSSDEGTMFGTSIAVSGDLAVVGAQGIDEFTGAVYAFRYDSATGTWSPTTLPTGSGIQPGDRFGTMVATDGRSVAVGSPRHGSGTGVVHIFNGSTGDWVESARLDGSDAGDGGYFGSALALAGDRLYVGAPRVDFGNGAVVAYGNDGGAWTRLAVVTPDTSLARGFFGTSLDAAGDELIVGVPGANERAGIALAYSTVGGFAPVATLQPEDLDPRDAFASTLAAGGDVVVAGVTTDDHGMGSARVYERVGGTWTLAASVVGGFDNVLAVYGLQVDCRDGEASAFGCEHVDLLSFMPVEELGGERGVRLNDVWGWTDPLTNREYAIVGRIDGTSFVDVTDPLNPVYKGNLPRTAGSPASTWRDMKTYANHVFIVADGADQHGMQVLDLTLLRDLQEPVVFEPTAHYTNIASAHNIVINEDTGYAYTVGNSSGGETCGGGLHMINIQEPANPVFAGCFSDPTTGRAGTGYSHDAMCVVYNGPDTEHHGEEICIGSNETAISIANVSDKANPIALSTSSYPNVGYAHQGWLTEDQRYFFLNDELDELNGDTDGTRTMIWDLADLDDPQLIREYVSTNKASDHNLYIHGNFMYQSNYQAGLRIYDVSDPANPRPAGHFDTVPYGTDSPGFGGSWSNYPFFRSGIVIVTSGNEGLFVLRKQQVDI